MATSLVHVDGDLAARVSTCGTGGLATGPYDQISDTGGARHSRVPQRTRRRKDPRPGGLTGRKPITNPKAAAPLIDPPAVPIGQQLTDLWSSTLSWISLHSAQIMVGAAVGLAIFALLHLIRRLGMRLCRRDQGVTGWATVFGRAIARTGNIFIVMVAVRLVIGYSNPPTVVTSTVNFLFIIAAVFQAAVWAREIILGVIEHRTVGEHGNEALGNAFGIIRLLVTVTVFAIALIVVLDNLGVNVTGLVAGLGVGGIAIGLAAQGIFSDLFAALSILFDKPFKRGDTINYDTSGGTVEAIGLKTTRLRAATGEQRIISNAQLLNKEIFNMTRLSHRRVQFLFGVIFQTPPDVADRIPGILEEIVTAHDHHFVRAGFIAFSASSLDYQLDFDVESPNFDKQFAGRHAVGIAILKRFNAEGIEFAYPTQMSFTAAPDGSVVMPYPESWAPSTDG